VSNVSAEALRKLFFILLLLAVPTQLLSPPKLPDTIQIDPKRNLHLHFAGENNAPHDVQFFPPFASRLDQQRQKKFMFTQCSVLSPYLKLHSPVASICECGSVCRRLLFGQRAAG
jgi:hypothetical protein